MSDLTPSLHDLKCSNPYFSAIWDGAKTFEIRWNNRGFLVGDEIMLRETYYRCDPVDEFACHIAFTGRWIRALITYITDFEQQPCFVVFSFKELGRGGGA